MENKKTDYSQICLLQNYICVLAVCVFSFVSAFLLIFISMSSTLLVTSSSTSATATLLPYSLVFIYSSFHDFKVFAQSLNSLSWEPLGYYSHK